MKPSVILENVPSNLHVEVGENHYSYAIQSVGLGTLTLSANGNPLSEISYDDAPQDFKQHLTQVASVRATITTIEKLIGRKVDSSRRVEDYLKAWQYLHTGDNAFLKLCAGIVFEYHALDRELTQTLLLGMSRASFSSVSALAHFDCTGASGAGKNDLVNRVVALVPPHYLDLFSTISPTALQYETLVREVDTKGRSHTRVNKDRFKNKIICITELADTTGYAALKALAETDEDAEFTHMATVNGESVKMTITGSRCVITTSVEGVNDTQVKRRFIHTSVNDDADNQLEKLELVEELLIEEKNIHDDERLKIAQAGIDLIFSTRGLVFDTIDSDAERLLKYLDVLFLEAGYGITNIKQFFTLCQCSALWKRFARGYCQIEVADVLEAWFLLATFERETITKTTQHGIAVLETIKELCEDFDRKFELDQEGSGPKNLYEPQRPTRTDIVKASDVPQATVYRLLQPRANAEGKLGELLELGYVVNQYKETQTVFELTDLGKTVLSDVPREATVNDKRYEPIEPLEVGNPGIEPLIPLETILERISVYADEKDDV
jgi:hypothetical protein